MVVFATPPFWFASAITCVSAGPVAASSGGECSGAESRRARPMCTAPLSVRLHASFAAAHSSPKFRRADAAVRARASPSARAQSSASATSAAARRAARRGRRARSRAARAASMRASRASTPPLRPCLDGSREARRVRAGFVTIRAGLRRRASTPTAAAAARASSRRAPRPARRGCRAAASRRARGAPRRARPVRAAPRGARRAARPGPPVFSASSTDARMAAAQTPPSPPSRQVSDSRTCAVRNGSSEKSDSSQRSSASPSSRSVVGERQPLAQLGGELGADLVEPRRLAARLRRRDRQHRRDAQRPEVEPLEDDGPAAIAPAVASRSAVTASASSAAASGGSASRGSSSRVSSSTQQPVDVAAELGRHQPARLGPELRDLAGDDRAQRDPAAELDVRAGREADDRRERDVGARRAEERPLEIRVRGLERLVLPVEAAAALGRPGQHRQQDRAEERVVAGRRRCRRARARRSRRQARAADRRSRCARRAAGAASAPAPRRSRARAAGTRTATARRASCAPRTRTAPARRARRRRRRDRTRAGTRRGVARAATRVNYARARIVSCLAASGHQ